MSCKDAVMVPPPEPPTDSPDVVKPCIVGNCCISSDTDVAPLRTISVLVMV
jgi:hypothetical protein